MKDGQMLQPERSTQGCSLTIVDAQSLIVKEREGARKGVIWRLLTEPHAEN